MEPECHQLHPNVPSILISNPPSSSCCLPCELSRLASPSLLHTRRRAAAANVLILASSPDQLLHRAAHYAPDLILHLLSTYFALHPTNDHDLCADIRNAVSALVIAFDAAMIPAPPSYPYLQLVITRTVDTSLRGNEQLTVLAAQIFSTVANGVRGASTLRINSVLNAIREGLANRPEFLPCLFGLLPSTETCFRNIADVANVVLAVVEPRQVDPQALLKVVEGAMPPRRIYEADVLLMQVVCELVSRKIEVCPNVPESAWDVRQIAQVLMASMTFVDSMKSCVLSDHVRTRSVATRIISALCDASSRAAEQMCSSSIFDYIVESIRTVSREENDLSADSKKLLSSSLESLAAIVEQEPSNLPDKWCYCLDVILSATRYASETQSARLVSRVLGHALRFAPAPVFSKELLTQVVSFQMSLITRMSQETNLEGETLESMDVINDEPRFGSVLRRQMGHWVVLLQRYRACIASVNDVLHICEAIIQTQLRFLCIVPVLAQLLRTFKELCRLSKEEQNSDNSKLQCTGQRLLFVVFDSCARAVEEAMKDAELDFESFFSVDELMHLLDMLAAALDSVFIVCGSCSKRDQQGMRTWCWKHVPSRAVFSVSQSLENAASETCPVELEHRRGIIQQYLMGITGLNEAGECDKPMSIPITTESLLQAIVAECDPRSTAWQYLWKGLSTDAVNSICAPEAVVQALSKRIQNCFRAQSQEPLIHCLDILRGISFVCNRYGLCFYSCGVPMDVLTSLVQHQDFSMSNSLDFGIFQNVMLWEAVGSTHVYLWDKFAEHYYSLSEPHTGEISAFWALSLQNKIVVKGALFALERSCSPQDIALCLLNMSEALNGAAKFVTSCQQVGANGLLCELLRKLKLFSHDFNEQPFMKELDVERERASSFLMMLSADLTFTAATADWNVLREGSELFVRDSELEASNASQWLLRASFVRWLIACMQTREQHSVGSYIHQSGVLGASIRLLQAVPAQNFLKDQYISTASCLILLLLKTLPHVVDFTRRELIALLRDHITWDRLLNSCSPVVVQDNAYKVTNCCHLLRELLVNQSLREHASTFVQSRRTTLLAIAASSSDQVLSNAALRVLQTIMEMMPEAFSEEESSSCHLQLSAYLLEKCCSFALASTTENELAYLASAVMCGHLRSNLHILHEAIHLWLEKLQSQSGDDRSSPSKQFLSALLKLAADMDGKANVNEKSISMLSSRLQAELKTVNLRGSTDHASADLRAPKIMFATHSVLWAGH